MRKRNKKSFFKSVITITVFAVSCFIWNRCLGETAPTPVVDEKFTVSVKEDTTLEPNAPTTASFVGLEDDRRFQAYDMTQIELTGKITETDKEAYTVEWTELRHIGNDRSAGLTVPMTTTEKQEKNSVIKDGTVLPVSAAKDQLTSVLPLLFFVPSGEKTDNESAVAGEASSPVIAVPVGGSGDKSSEEKNSFDSSAIEVAEQPQDEIAFRLDECPIRIDWENEHVYYQSEVVKSVNGQEVVRQGCQDSDFPIDILRAYSLCADDVVLADKKAFKMYKPYFLDKGEQKFLKECTRDEEQAFDIKENLDCLPQIDMNGKKVLEQSYLYYTDDTDRAVTVSECQTRDTTRTFDLRFTYDTCSIRVDGEKNVAYQQGKYVYDKDGTTIDVTSCQDSDLTYPVSDEFCYYRDNLAAKKAVRYERKKVNTVNGLHYLTDCQPVSQTDIFETSEECEGLHKDDFTAGFSYGYSRYYYVNDKNARVYLTECAVNATTYPHQAVIEDWQVDFENLNATSLIAYYIDLPSGRVKISDAAVTKDSIAVPLARQSEQIVKTDEYTDAGCWRNYKQELLETYLLPNGKTIENRTSLTETSPVYICRDEEQEGTASYCAYRNCSGFSCILLGRYRTYTATYTRTLSNHKETGASVCSAWTQTAISSQKSKTCDKSRPCGTSYILNGTCINGQAAPDEQCK